MWNIVCRHLLKRLCFLGSLPSFITVQNYLIQPPDVRSYLKSVDKFIFFFKFDFEKSNRRVSFITVVLWVYPPTFVIFHYVDLQSMYWFKVSIFVKTACHNGHDVMTVSSIRVNLRLDSIGNWNWCLRDSWIFSYSSAIPCFSVSLQISGL